MSRDDIEVIIEAYSNFCILNDKIKEFSDIVNPNKYSGLYNLLDVLMRYFHVNDYEKATSILEDNSIDSREKYDRLLLW